LERILNCFETSEIVTGKMPTKANLKRQVRLRENKGTVNSPIVFANFIITHKTAPKPFQITRKAYNIFIKLTCVVSYSL
jgi:hypothetical protein